MRSSSYWFFTPLVTGIISRFVIFLTAAPVLTLLDISWNAFKNHTYHGFGLISRQWLGIQALEIFLLADFIGYRMHRLFHGRSSWSSRAKASRH